MQLVVGAQRSYSDVCRGEGVRRPGGPRIVSVHGDSLRVSSFVTLYEVLINLPPGWTLPVMPGTGWATIGGCIANDVHGKNHRKRGSFGNHISEIQLRTSDDRLRLLQPGEPLFAATVGGLGLTGEIEQATIKLIRGRPRKAWLFPLDYVPGYWPFYKHMGFWQFHFVVPSGRAASIVVKKALRHQIPFLVRRKQFGAVPSAGMLSFCRPGISISMDFVSPSMLLQGDLEWITLEEGGAVYPAKTSMSAETFKASFPRWKEFSQYVDPSYSSDFWKRVSA